MREEEEGYIVEYVAFGKSVKVTAVDPVTATEAAIVAPVKASRREIAKLAIRKLQYVLKKDKGE